jgi:hypothetical protein
MPHLPWTLSYIALVPERHQSRSLRPVWITLRIFRLLRYSRPTIQSCECGMTTPVLAQLLSSSACTQSPITVAGWLPGMQDLLQRVQDSEHNSHHSRAAAQAAQSWPSLHHRLATSNAHPQTQFPQKGVHPVSQAVTGSLSACCAPQDSADPPPQGAAGKFLKGLAAGAKQVIEGCG